MPESDRRRAPPVPPGRRCRSCGRGRGRDGGAGTSARDASAGAGRLPVEQHLAIASGTDLALFNALLTYVADQGWLDQDFIDAHSAGFDEALAANRTSLEDAAAITGLTVDQIRQAAEWIAAPKDGQRRRTMHSYEKGLIWGNDNYRTNGALVNLALATGNIGREGGGQRADHPELQADLGQYQEARERARGHAAGVVQVAGVSRGRLSRAPAGAARRSNLRLHGATHRSHHRARKPVGRRRTRRLRGTKRGG